MRTTMAWAIARRPQRRRATVGAMASSSDNSTTRRRVLQTLGSAPLLPLFGCGGDDGSGSGGSGDGSSSGGDDDDGSSGASLDPTTDGGSGDDSSDGIDPDSSSGEASSDGSSGDPTTTGADCPPVAGWATGGTAAMCGVYPDPFERGLGNACELLCSATLGPCYDTTFDRKDISEGANGLPVRMAFLVVDETCTPVEGAEVDIWHTSADGFYSGETASPGCTLGDPEAIAGHWFRGIQTSGADGRVDFDTCFPGWYGGRTIHIHITVRIGATEYVTSQLYFDDALCDSIVAEEPVYSDRGPRDTTNAEDGIFPDASGTKYIFETEHMEDGAMLAWKALVIRASTAVPLCSE
jgi:protocatechuate 3,4-dioxygenase beta subunit